MISLTDNINGFKRLDGETIHEAWLQFQNVFLQYLNNELPKNFLLQHFCCNQDSVNKGVANQLVCGCIRQVFEISYNSFDGMTKINRYLYNREDQVYSLNFRMTKEEIEQNQERDQNIGKIMSTK